MSQLTIEVNGRKLAVTAAPDTPLLFVLRDQLGLHGPRFGCGLSECGACTVLLGKQSIRSCVTPVAGAAAQPITTLEGLGTPEKPHPLQTAFIAEQAAQCGFCINGMLMASASFLERSVLHARSTDAEIKKAMQPWLCRCGTHYRIVAAIKRAAKQMPA
jgi:nicotinate dehydrogenase subunit A